jgi:DNA-binding HxlR family transcriptional regulator
VVAYDIFVADCPARTTLDLVGDTWSVIAVVALDRGPARYTQLLERIEGISKKMLTQTLRKLEDQPRSRQQCRERAGQRWQCNSVTRAGDT